jgi:hypothetical protein
MDNLVFGNPTTKYVTYLRSEGKYDYLLESLKPYNPPPNQSETVKDELRTLLNLQRHHSQNDVELIQRYKDFDKDVQEPFKQYCTEVIGVDLSKVIESLVEETKTLLIKLKYHFNRPRPFQLAYYYKAPLIPLTSNTTDTPSYPSGHSFQAHLLAEVIGSLYPVHYKDLNYIATDISRSRMFFGFHFESDIEFSMFCANALLKDKNFTKEYGI